MTITAPIDCFMVEPNGVVARWLRRYTRIEGSGFTCAEGYHQAWKRIRDAKTVLDAKGMVRNGQTQRRNYRPDAWPATCQDCDFAFEVTTLADYTYQLFPERLYVRADGEAGGPWINRWRSPKGDKPPCLPPGAMFYAEWNDFWVGPDGKCLVVIIPTDVPEPWMADGPATGGGHWTRTGTPPMVTITPSIHAVGRGYHGWVTNGQLMPG